MSEIRADKLHNASGDNDSGIDLSTNDQVDIKIADSVKARVDSSGNVSLGTTSITTGTLGTSNKFLEVGAGTADGSGTLVLSRDTSSNGVEMGAVRFVNANNATDGSNNNSGKLVGVVGCRTVTTDTNAGDDSGGDLVFSTKPETGTLAERMRISSDGEVLFNTTSRPSASVGGASFEVATNDRMILNLGCQTTLNRNVAVFRNTNNAVGNIAVSGTSTSFNTSSDYRLKENVTADWNATTRLKQLNPVRFNFIADADTTLDGFLAHEVSDIVPEAISGEKDAVDDDGNAVYQGIDQSKLVPLLVKTIQELEARIAALESK